MIKEFENKNTVSKTVKLDLCTACEICNASCPVGAIKMNFNRGQFVPEIDDRKCTKCETCYNLCPGIDLDPFDLAKNQNKNADLVGDFKKCYTAYCKDQSTRKNSVSGGMVTTIVLDLLEKDLYSKVFVLEYGCFNNKTARLKSTNNIENILNSARSKYISASVYNVIKELKENREGKYIIVGTGCQFLGIKKYIKQFNLNGQNYLFLGLFCDKSLNFNIYKYFEKKYARSNEKIKDLVFRSKENGGWPGDIKITFNSSREIFIHRRERMKVKEYFQLNRCLFCTDKFNRQADISFGDCYIKGEEEENGKSSVIVRTDNGRKVLNLVGNKIKLNEVGIEKIKDSQKINNKYNNLEHARFFIDNNISASKFDTGEQAKKRLKKYQKKIRLGRDQKYIRINFNIFKNKILSLIEKICKLLKIFIVIFKIVLFDVFKSNKVEVDKLKKNIVIIGGGNSNKGAQAMTFSVVSEAKKHFLNKDIYSFTCDKDIYKYKNKLRYNLRSINLSQKIELLKNTDDTKTIKKLRDILINTCIVFDVSGYALSSQRGFIRSANYIVDIMLSKKYNIAHYILPQSIGPFNYNLFHRIALYPLMKLYLRYPLIIYAREDDSLKNISKFTSNNIRRSYDIVLQSDYKKNIESIVRDFKNVNYSVNNRSVGIIPNIRVAERVNGDDYYSFYKTIIRDLLESGISIYLIQYSNEDNQICSKLKDYFKTSKVISVPAHFNTVELESIISQLDYIIASRYHSVIHAYKNGIPAVVIGWANKYYELLKSYRQLKYYYDCRDKFNNTDIKNIVDTMKYRWMDEKKIIFKKTEEVKRDNVFREII